MADLLRKVESVAFQQGARKVAGVKVKLGALCHISPEHFRDYFGRATQGTMAEGAALDIDIAADPADHRAQDIYLESVTLEA
jgi:hydrogenase nickel incorporation protein HypA/HybF